MRVLIVTPTYFPEITGNAVDVDRIVKGLRDKGINVEVITPKQKPKYTPDLVHIFHAYKSRIGMKYARKYNVPMITSITGTDINRDVNTDKKKAIYDVVNFSIHVTFLNEQSMNIGKDVFPDFSYKFKVISKGIPIIEETKFRFREHFGYTDSDIVFGVIGGIRPVKRNYCLVKPLIDLKERYQKIKIAFIGQILDKAFFKEFRNQIKNLDWMTYLGEIPRKDIRAVYEALDIVSVCSESEGSSNVIVEALYLGKLIIASDIPGNRALIKDGFNGLLFQDEDSYVIQAERILEDNHLKESLTKNAKSTKLNKKEIDEYLELYRSI